jgi:hypothetical protein
MKSRIAPPAALAVSLCLLALALPALAGQSPEQPQPQPRIEFGQTSFDFGAIYQNDEVIHVFAFRNTGNATLEIENVKSTCGCTAALPGTRELAPGAESTVKVTFRSGAMRYHVTKHIYIDSNDPVEPRVTLTIEGEVKVEVEVDPRGIYLGQVKVGEKVERTVEITPVDVKSFKIADATSDSPNIRVGRPQPLPDKRPGYRLTITFGPLDRTGPVNAKVTVHTDLPHSREIVIPVYGKVVGEDASQPPRRQ